MIRRFVALLVAGLGLAQAAGPDYARIRQKVEAIEGERLPAKSQVSFTVEEAHVYVREEVRREVGDAVTNPRLQFGAGRVTGRAVVDFAKVQTARGRPPGLLLGWLLRGDREVEATIRWQSAAGKGRVDIEEVAISGIPISGRPLNLLIEYYVLPRYPEAKIGEWFDLRHRVDRIDLSVNGVRIFIDGSPPAR